MARNFNTNQNRHIYVADKYVDLSDETVKIEEQEGHPIGLKTAQGKGNVNKEIYFVYKGADTVLRSNLIQVKNIDYVKAVKAEDLRTPFKSQIVTLDTDVNEGKPVVGQDYILRIVLRQWIGMSDEDTYVKDVAVHATKAMATDESKFYDALIASLNLAFSREVGATPTSNPYLSFKKDTKTVVTGKDTDGNNITESVTGVVITEKAQPWRLGLEQQLPVLFDAQPTTIYTDNDDYVWGKVYDATPKKSEVTVDGDAPTGYGNGHNIADLEYFAMGERGDQYREIGFPNYIPTTYLVEPDKEYNVLEIHHAFTDDGISSYRSDKDITIVSTDASVIDSITAAIKKETGIETDTLASSASSEETSGAKTNILIEEEE